MIHDLSKIVFERTKEQMVVSIIQSRHQKGILRKTGNHYVMVLRHGFGASGFIFG